MTSITSSRFRIFALSLISLLAVAAAISLAASSASAQTATFFSATLLGSDEVPPISATSSAVTTGRGMFVIADAGASSTIQYTLYATSTSPVTGAHLHCGVLGANGPIIASLFSNASGTTNMATTSTSTPVFAGLLASGMIHSADITAAGATCSPAIYDAEDLAAAIRAGSIYANVHTLASPSGAARGQLIPIATTTATTTPTTTPATTTPPRMVSIEVMKHMCSVRTQAEFDAIGASATTSLAHFLMDEAACPVVTLAGDTAPMGTINGGHATFDFSLRQSGSSTILTLSRDASFQSEKACESDIGVDVNRDGRVSTSTCYSISHYRFPAMVAASGTATLMETMAPAGTHFGTFAFTPVELGGGGDVESFVTSDASGTIILKPASTTNSMLMLHVYNFANATSAPTTTPPTVPGTTTPTSTPPTTPTTTPPSAPSDRVLAIVARLQAIIERILDLIERLQLGR